MIPKWLKSWIWSSYRSNENWAQTLVRVFGNLFRIAVTLVLLIVLIAIGFFAWDSYKSSQPKPSDAVSVYVENRTTSKARNDDGSPFCTEEYPLLVFIYNRSDKAITSIVLQLTARREGSSTNTLGYADKEITVDKIIPPDHVYGSCYRNIAAQNDPSLIFSASFYSFELKLSDLESWMLEETDAGPITDKSIEFENSLTARSIR